MSTAFAHIAAVKQIFRARECIAATPAGWTIINGADESVGRSMAASALTGRLSMAAKH
jgi:hypothetical protein